MQPKTWISTLLAIAVSGPAFAMPGWDDFEPNDTRGNATSIGEGEYAGLYRSGRDWYRIQVPPGKSLRVVTEFDHAAGDIDMFLEGPGYVKLMQSRGVEDREELRCDAAAGQEILLCVYGGDGSEYALEVRFEDFESADRYEPNDTPESAKELEVGVHEGLVRAGDDYYRIKLPAERRVRVVARFEHTSGDIDLELSRAQGETVARSIGFQNEEAVEFGDGLEEELIVRVKGGQGNTYSLEVALLDWEPADRFEPNDTPEQAKPLEEGLHEDLVMHNQDYYTLEVPGGQQVRLRLVVVGDGYYSASLYDMESGANVYASMGEELIYGAPGETPRPLQLNVYGQDDTTYALEVVFEEYMPADPFEPNDTMEGAARLEAGVTDGLVRQLDDYYRIAVPEGQNVVVTARFSGREGDIDIELLGPYGEWLGNSSGVEDSETVSWGPGQGEDVILHVYGGAGNTYSVEIGFEEWTPPDPYEPNDNMEDAAALEAGTYADLVLVNDDWYAIEATAGQTVTVRLAFEHDNGDVDLDVVDANYSNLGSSTGVDDSEEVQFVAPQDGTYYVRVYLSPNTYTLTVEID